MEIQKDKMFGDITVYPAQEGKQRVEIYIRAFNPPEGMKIGIAIDASNSMREAFAAHFPPFLRQEHNVVEPIVRRLCRHGCKYSPDGTVSVIYWAVGTGGKAIEPVGHLNDATSEIAAIEGPQDQVWGTGTELLPPLEHFLSEFQDAKLSIVLFTTDGVINDLEEVMQRSRQVAQEIVNGQRQQCKFIIVGCGSEVSLEQINKLDNLDSEVDLWDGKIANEMRELEEIWDEVDFGVTLPGTARISTEYGEEVMTYSDGIPQRMEFFVPEGTTSLIIEMFGKTIAQTIQ
jgi:hypothetical protein